MIDDNFFFKKRINESVWWKIDIDYRNVLGFMLNFAKKFKILIQNLMHETFLDTDQL